jgi:DnaJ-class molecular chaperone
MSENFYNVLGISEKASRDEIKRAYRSLQMKYHPDKNPGNPECMNMTQKINEAYEILGDEQKKQEYDFTRNNPNPFTNIRMNSGGSNIPMDDILNMFFGFPGMPGMQGMPGGPNIRIFHSGPMGFQEAVQKPSTINKTISITMEQVLTGATIPVEIEKWVMENGVKVHELETIYVNIPQGIDDNEFIIIQNRGNSLSDVLKGDIKIVIKIENNTNFKRLGLDLILDKSITLKEALCGFSFEIKYINGKSYTLNNNKGNIIPPEYKKVYPDMGLKRGEHKGNMIIHFHLEFPEVLTMEQIEQLSNVL